MVELKNDNNMNIRLMNKRIVLSFLMVTATVITAVAGEPFGVNLACGEFGSVFPGVYGTHYTYPTDADLDYWDKKGLKLVRLPFRWERLQNVPGGRIVDADLQCVKRLVAAAAERGMKVILDMHNYCRRYDNGEELVIGTSRLPYECYGQFWRMMAEEMRGFDNIYGYGLMNEPHDLPDGVSWFRMAQTAIDSIRQVDDHTDILVGGCHWSSARRWRQLSDHLKNLRDDAGRLVFEAHCYFDFDGSGTYKFTYEQEEGSPTKGVELVAPFVEWLKENGLRGIVGEYGIPDSDGRWLETLDNFLAYLAENGVNATYWASGPWWDDAVMTIPTWRGGKEKPQVGVMEKYKETFDAGSERVFGHGELAVDASNRYLQHADGTPFLYLADTAWELLARLTTEEACRYLDDRMAKGFTVVQAVVLPELHRLSDYAAAGMPLLADTVRGVLHEKYMQHIDTVISEAYRRGIYMALVPVWGDKVDKKWGLGPELFDCKKAIKYGTTVGRRWGQRPNVIWIMGGDRGAEGKAYRVWNEMAKAIGRHSRGQLMTYHPHGEHSSGMWLHDAPWLDFNMIQSGHCQSSYEIYRRLLLPAIDAVPQKPVVDGEPRYEGIPMNFDASKPRFTAADVRRSLYQCMLSGAAGYAYGNNNIWQMYGPGKEPVCHADRYWYEALDMEGACQLHHFVRLWHKYDFRRSVPFTAPRPADDYRADEAVARLFRDALVCYFPGGRAWTVELPEDYGDVQMTLFCPRTGDVRNVCFPIAERHIQVTLPVTDDWVLVVKKNEPTVTGRRER